MDGQRKPKLTQRNAGKAAARALGILRKWYQLDPTDQIDIHIRVKPGCRKPSVADRKVLIQETSKAPEDKSEGAACEDLGSSTSGGLKSDSIDSYVPDCSPLDKCKSNMNSGLIRYVKSKWNVLSGSLGRKDRRLLDSTLRMLNPAFVLPKFSDEAHRRWPAKEKFTTPVAKSVPVVKVVEDLKPLMVSEPLIKKLISSAINISRHVCIHFDLNENKSGKDLQLVEYFVRQKYSEHRTTDCDVELCERINQAFEVFKAEYNKADFDEPDRMASAVSITTDLPIIAACWLLWRRGELASYFHLMQYVPKDLDWFDARSRLGTVRIDREMKKIPKLPLSLDDQLILNETRREIAGTNLRYRPGTLADKAVALGKANGVLRCNRNGVRHCFS